MVPRLKHILIPKEQSSCILCITRKLHITVSITTCSAHNDIGSRLSLYVCSLVTFAKEASRLSLGNKTTRFGLKVNKKVHHPRVSLFTGLCLHHSYNTQRSHYLYLVSTCLFFSLFDRFPVEGASEIPSGSHLQMSNGSLEQQSLAAKTRTPPPSSRHASQVINI